MWLRFQRESTLSQWYQSRVGASSARWRKGNIVALVRKLLMALWKYLETREFSQGAVLVLWEKKLNGRLPAATRPA
jgi:transposase